MLDSMAVASFLAWLTTATIIYGALLAMHAFRHRITLALLMPVGLRATNGRLRVLVVDDQATNRALLIRLLPGDCFDLREGANGAEALELNDAWKPDVILMDMSMPVMDGYEAIRRIKGEAGAHVPVIIAVSASAFEEQREEIMAAGADDFLRKPFRDHELYSLLAGHLPLEPVYAHEALDANRSSCEDGAEDVAGVRMSAASLPETLKAALVHAAETGDLFRVYELLNGLEVDSELAESLRALADAFDYEGLIAALRQE